MGAKQVAKERVQVGWGLSLINYYAKTNKQTNAGLISVECLVPVGLHLAGGERKA